MTLTAWLPVCGICAGVGDHGLNKQPHLLIAVMVKRTDEIYTMVSTMLSTMTYHSELKSMSGQDMDVKQGLFLQLQKLEKTIQEHVETIQERDQTIQAFTEREQDIQKSLQNTTFPEFLKLCHKQLSVPLQVEANRTLTTKGPITNPRGKMYPTELRLWDDFPQTQQDYFDQAYALLYLKDSSPYRVFTSREYIERRGEVLCGQRLASEKDLERYEHGAVQEQVVDVIMQLAKLSEAQSLINQCSKIVFANQLNSLGHNSEEVLECKETSRTDQACFSQNEKGDQSLLFIREYKAAHKLTVESLRVGLRPMMLRQDVVNRPTIPQDPDEKLKYNADRLVAAAVTQTFQYMIENGLEYSCIGTGQAEVYLRVKEDDPTIVYYYLAEPSLDVGDSDGDEFHYSSTAVARMLGFVLMALKSCVRDQEWRAGASKSLGRWAMDFEDILRRIPSDERHATPPASVYIPRTHPVNPRSPYMLRSRRQKALPLSYDVVPTASPKFDGSSSDEFLSDTHGHTSKIETPSRVNATTNRKRSASQSVDDRGQTRQYCTQKCLLGLKHQRALDAACPNYRSHQRHPASRSHQVNLERFHQLLYTQLEADRDHHCEPLGKQGARGALFKITLASHGYTFVGKGTVEVFIPYLRHEGKMYDQLTQLQGSTVPVCLGNMDLAVTYFLDIGVRIVHMLYMSWGGECLYLNTPSVPAATLEHEMQRSLKEVARLIRHNDIRSANMLWNVQSQRVMVIDFERSTLCPRKRKMERLDVIDP